VREAGAAVQQRELPFTGSDVPLIIIAGAAAIAAGALLRRCTDGGMRRT
jgi:LPXTG-motif cell wall-anchored protein